jgi:hypothetical protein
MVQTSLKGLACREITFARPFEIKHCLNHLEFAIYVEVFKGQTSIMVCSHFESQNIFNGFWGKKCYHESCTCTPAEGEGEP